MLSPRLSSTTSFCILIFFLIFVVTYSHSLDSEAVLKDSESSSNLQKPRIKRQYYDEGYAIGNYYGCGDDSRQFGRILGWGLGCLLVLLCLCLPCVCCIGIWFAGWFGLRRAMQNRSTTAQQPTQPLSIISSSRRRSVQPTATTTTIIPPSLSSPSSGPLPAGTIIEQRSPSSGMIDETGVDGARIQRVIYTHASDRFFERRRDQQPPQPSSPPGRYYGREHRY